MNSKMRKEKRREEKRREMAQPKTSLKPWIAKLAWNPYKIFTFVRFHSLYIV